MGIVEIQLIDLGHGCFVYTCDDIDGVSVWTIFFQLQILTFLSSSSLFIFHSTPT